MDLLLISNSYSESRKYLEHCQDRVIQFLDKCPPGQVIFIPYAAYDLDEFSNRVGKFFIDNGYNFKSIHEFNNAKDAIENGEIKAIFAGGGNTFRLLKTMQDKDLLKPIIKRVKSGIGYMGTSAGSNIACPTIMTTNDMPIVEPADFKALGLVDFQINAHYLAGPLVKNHHGETREQRIKEYHQENSRIVIGMPEQCWIFVHGKSAILEGKDAAIFEKNKPQRVWKAGTKL